MANMPQEDVLVVPRALFDRVGAFQGFCADTAAYLPALLDRAHTSWRPRATDRKSTRLNSSHRT